MQSLRDPSHPCIPWIIKAAVPLPAPPANRICFHSKEPVGRDILGLAPCPRHFCGFNRISQHETYPHRRHPPPPRQTRPPTPVARRAARPRAHLRPQVLVRRPHHHAAWVSPTFPDNSGRALARGARVHVSRIPRQPPRGFPFARAASRPRQMALPPRNGRHLRSRRPPSRPTTPHPRPRFGIPPSPQKQRSTKRVRFGDPL